MNPDLPAELERIINKALEKDRELRCQTAKELLTDLRRLKRDSESGKAAPYPSAKAPVSRRWTARHWVPGAALVILCTGIWAYFRFFRREVPLPPPRIIQVTSSTGSKSGPSLSPDGNWIAFAWEGERRDNWDIYVKDLTSPGEPTRLTFDPA